MWNYQWLSLLLLLPASALATPDTDYAIAARYAPILFQETGIHPKSDAITNVDFDGDWATNNNWDNLSKFPAKAYVYYSVIESKSHYFITYGFYHARDWSIICLPWVCHENDLEGAALAVEKSSRGPGKVVHLETKAHLSMVMSDQPPTASISQITDGPRTAVFIQKQGHGVYPWAQQKSGSNFFTYYYAGAAQDPNGAAQGAIGYELLPIETTLWAHRNSIGKGQTFGSAYDYVGTRFQLGPVPFHFAGEKWTYHVVSVPWSWGDGGWGQLKLGDWFFDPALAFSRRAQGLTTPVSLEYVHNPYVGIFRPQDGN